MATPLRIGVVGAGAIATLGHIPGFQKLPDVQVVAVCDSNAERAQSVAAQFSIPHTYTDYRELVERPDLDAVSVGVPNALHAPVTLAALAAGKHVLCEKPLAVSVSDGQAMVAAAERAGRILAVNMHNRLRGEMALLRELVAAGQFGTISYVHARMLRRHGIPGFGSWFTRRDLAGGGVLMDIGVHMIDLSLWLLGFPEVTAVRGEVQANHGPHGRGLGGWGVDRVAGGTFDVDDLAVTHLRLAGGGLVTVEVSWALHGRDENRVQIAGDESGADVFPDLYGSTTPLRLYRNELSGPVEVIPTVPRLAGSDWDRSMARFVGAIRDGGAPTATGAEALRVLTLIDATYRSSAQGGEITL